MRFIFWGGGCLGHAQHGNSFMFFSHSNGVECNGLSDIFSSRYHTRVVGKLCSGAQGRDRYLVGRRHRGGGYARLPKVVGNTCMIEGRNSRGAAFFSYGTSCFRIIYDLSPNSRSWGRGNLIDAGMIHLSEPHSPSAAWGLHINL